jgi:RNA polymerase sigma-70 factor, ECF subfamily
MSITALCGVMEQANNRFHRDALLVAAAKQGAAEAFDRLQLLYSRQLYRTILSITRSPEDTEDVLQDTFLRAFTSLHHFEGRSNIYSWLTRIAINTALMLLRKRRTHSEVLFDPEGQPQEESPHFELVDSSLNPEQLLDQTQRRVRLLRTVQKLDPKLRTPLLIYMHQGWSIKEIGQSLDLSEAAIKSRLYRARKRILKAHLSGSVRNRNRKQDVNKQI